MALIRLLVCVFGVYSTFLLWAIAQERLSSPFPTYPPHPSAPNHGDKFPSPTFINVLQSLSSCSCALAYLLFKRWNHQPSEKAKGKRPESSPVERETLLRLVGWDAFFRPSPTPAPVEVKKLNGTWNGKPLVSSNGTITESKTPVRPGLKARSSSFKRAVKTFHEWRTSLPVLLLQVSMFQTMASPIGFASLRYISYPTMVLGKSCKLIPVLLLNVLLYRRKFKPYKYVVVALVSVGISMFMLFGESGKGKKGAGGNSSWGLMLLGINLLIDGLTNSTQDEMFALHPTFTGQQLMFTMSFLSLLITLPLVLIPPHITTSAIQLVSHLIPIPLPLPTVPSSAPFPTQSTLALCLTFIHSHPTCLIPLLQYALLGGLGQLFIFETLSNFGSLTLVMLTVTRKLVSMLLSVVLFDHRFTPGQWVGVGVVFGGIGLEAAMKRKEIKVKQRASEQQKAKLKAT